MDKFIKDIRITNFKSIKDCKVEKCKRINLFIGRPNVGKSNILEALSLFTLPETFAEKSLKFTDFVRTETEIELFYNGDVEVPSEINIGKENCSISYNPKSGLEINLNHQIGFTSLFISDKFKISGLSSAEETRVKKYVFNPAIGYRKSHSKYLIPPYGPNLFSIIENYAAIKKETRSIFTESNLDVAMDRGSGTLKVIQKDKTGNIFLVPYSSIADTLQRIIFYKAAIASNNDRILLFEEPESHSFPPYISKITQDIIAKKDNQFFITTHSPVILNDLLENAIEELTVYIVYWDDHQTKVRGISSKELKDVLENGVDLFTNSESYT